MKKIVFINQSTGYLTIDIVNAFADNFDRVALLTGSVRVQDMELNSRVHLVKLEKLRKNALDNSVNFTYRNAQKYYEIYCNHLDQEK